MLSIRRATIDEYCTGFLIVLGSAFFAMQIGTIQAWGIQPPTGLTQYAYRQWRFDDAGLLGTPPSLTQLAEGYLWVSTEDGLFRLDGLHFRKWEPHVSESLPSSFISHLLGTRNESIHLGTDLGLARITNGHIHIYPSTVLWPGSFCEDAQDYAWMGVKRVQSAPETICKLGESNFKYLSTADWFNCVTGMANTVAPAWYQTLVFRLGALLSVVLTLGLAYLYRLRSDTRALKLRFDMRLEERTRIARDLHDTLLQTIQGSKMVADAARSNIDDRVVMLRTLDRLSDWLDRASHEGRAALESLRTANDEGANIIETLRRAASDCCAGIKIIPTIVTSGIVRDLRPIAQDEIYRIGYEAIRNACLISNAGELQIKVGFHRTFQLEIHDNGQGRSDESLNFGRPGYFGLTGMRERASQLGGRLEIESSPRHGTTISLRLPGHAVYKTTPVRFRAFFSHLFTPKGSVDKDMR